MASEKTKKTNKAACKTVNKVPSKTASKPASKTEKTAGKGEKTRHSAPIDVQAFAEKMEQTLLKQKSEIVDNLVASNNDFKEIVEGMDPKDFADIASDDIDRRMIETLGTQELKRLKLIDSALTRIKQGKYGVCIKCGKRIPQKRLEAVPYALMCVDCKSEDERRNR